MPSREMPENQSLTIYPGIRTNPINRIRNPSGHFGGVSVVSVQAERLKPFENPTKTKSLLLC